MGALCVRVFFETCEMRPPSLSAGDSPWRSHVRRPIHHHYYYGGTQNAERTNTYAGRYYYFLSVDSGRRTREGERQRYPRRKKR